MNYAPTTLRIESWRENTSGGTRKKNFECYWFRSMWTKQMLEHSRTSSKLQWQCLKSQALLSHASQTPAQEDCRLLRRWVSCINHFQGCGNLKKDAAGFSGVLECRVQLTLRNRQAELNKAHESKRRFYMTRKLPTLIKVLNISKWNTNCKIGRFMDLVMKGKPLFISWKIPGTREILFSRLIHKGES